MSENRELTFTVPGPPQPKERPRTVWRQGRPVTFTPSRTSRYENTVRLFAQAAASRARPPWRPVAGARYALEVVFYFPDERRRDVDNAIKIVADAINGVAYLDDSQLAVVHGEKRLDRARPRAEIWVRVL